MNKVYHPHKYRIHRDLLSFIVPLAETFPSFFSPLPDELSYLTCAIVEKNGNGCNGPGRDRRISYATHPYSYSSHLAHIPLRVIFKEC